MKLKEFIDQLNDRYTKIPEYRRDDENVVVEVQLLGSSIGGTPCVNVTGFSGGFDWDSGKFFLHTEKPIALAGEDFEKSKKLQHEYAETIAWIKMQLKDSRLKTPSDRCNAIAKTLSTMDANISKIFKTEDVQS